MNFICKEYRLNLNEISNEYANIYDCRACNKNFIIIEAQNYTNPIEYSKLLYYNLKLEGTEVIIIDLSSLVGISRDSFYIWNFKGRKGILINETFDRIESIENNKYGLDFKKYLLNKCKKVRQHESVRA